MEKTSDSSSGISGMLNYSKYVRCQAESKHYQRLSLFRLLNTVGKDGFTTRKATLTAEVPEMANLFNYGEIKVTGVLTKEQVAL